MIPAGVDLEPHLALRRDFRRARARARRAARRAPRVDLLALMGGWTDPPRSRPAGLDPAAQFLHDAFDGVAAGVAPLVPRSVPPASPLEALEILYGCDCKEGAKKGDPCGQGGTVAADADWEYDPWFGGACRIEVRCVNQACYDTAEHWMNGQTTSEKRAAASRACNGGGGAPVSISCSYDGEACNCTTTIACNDGSTGTTDVTLDAMGSVDDDITDWDLDLCEPSSDWTMPGWEAGWGEAPGGGSDNPSPGGDAGGSSGTNAGSGDWFDDLKQGLRKSVNRGCVYNYSTDVVVVRACPASDGTGGQEMLLNPGEHNCPLEESCLSSVDWDFAYSHKTGNWYKVSGTSCYAGGAIIDDSGCISGCDCRVTGPCRDCA